MGSKKWLTGVFRRKEAKKEIRPSKPQTSKLIKAAVESAVFGPDPEDEVQRWKERCESPSSKITITAAPGGVTHVSFGRAFNPEETKTIKVLDPISRTYRKIKPEEIDFSRTTTFYRSNGTLYDINGDPVPR